MTDVDVQSEQACRVLWPSVVFSLQCTKDFIIVHVAYLVGGCT